MAGGDDTVGIAANDRSVAARRRTDDEAARSDDRRP
jgi:hypothetical protein